MNPCLDAMQMQTKPKLFLFTRNSIGTNTVAIQNGDNEC